MFSLIKHNLKGLEPGDEEYPGEYDVLYLYLADKNLPNCWVFSPQCCYSNSLGTNKI